MGSSSYHFSVDHPLFATAFVVYSFIYAYVDLSSYTDLALGSSSFFGFRIMENFHNPLFKPNLGRVLAQLAHLALELVPQQRLLSGLRHDAQGLAGAVCLHAHDGPGAHDVDLNWAVWGLYHGSGLIAVARWERFKRRWTKRWRKTGRPRWTYLLTPSGYIATFVFVALGYLFVSTGQITHAGRVFVWALAGPFVWLTQHMR